jgi:microcystin-dependent protein
MVSGINTTGVTGASGPTGVIRQDSINRNNTVTLTSGTVSSFGNDQPHNNVQPTIVANCMIRVLN